MMKQYAYTDRITAELVTKGLRTAFIGHPVDYLPSTPSTNIIAQKLAREGAAEGTVVVTDYQTQGRGRLERKWLSSPGKDLLFSVILRPRLVPARAFQVTLISSLAVARAIRQETGLEALIKWPNDIYIRGKKVSGILTELGMCGGTLTFAIVGIGINSNSDPSLCPEIQGKATSLRIEAGRPVARLPLLAMVLELLERFYVRLEHGEFTALKAMWDALSLIKDKKVTLSCGEEMHEGIAEAVTDDGVLITRDRDGRRHSFIVGDVSLSLK